MVSWILMSLAVALLAAVIFSCRVRLTDLETYSNELTKALNEAMDNVEAIRTLANELKTKADELEKEKLSKQEFTDWVLDGKARGADSALEEGFANMLSYNPFKKKE